MDNQSFRLILLKIFIQVWQLAAALVWYQGDPLQQGFVRLDQQLREAACREGFTLFPNKM